MRLQQALAEACRRYGAAAFVNDGGPRAWPRYTIGIRAGNRQVCTGAGPSWEAAISQADEATARLRALQLQKRGSVARVARSLAIATAPVPQSFTPILGKR